MRRTKDAADLSMTSLIESTPTRARSFKRLKPEARVRFCLELYFLAGSGMT